MGWHRVLEHSYRPSTELLPFLIGIPIEVWVGICRRQLPLNMHPLRAFVGKNNAMDGSEVRGSGRGPIPKFINSSRSFCCLVMLHFRSFSSSTPIDVMEEIYSQWKWHDQWLCAELLAGRHVIWCGMSFDFGHSDMFNFRCAKASHVTRQPWYRLIHNESFQYVQPPSTLPETNVAPENGWLEYYFPFGMAYFQG